MNDAAGHQPFVKATASRPIEHVGHGPGVSDATKAAADAQAMGFQLHDGLETHLSGYPSCRGCSMPSRSCDIAGCSGLVHTEDCADIDQTQAFHWLSTACDQCGDLTATHEMSIQDANSIWDARDRRRLVDKEKTRRKTHPTPAEIVAAWIEAEDNCPIYNPECKEVIELLCTDDGQIYEDYPSDGLIDIKRLQPPQGAAGSLDGLFFSDQRAQIFAAFMDELSTRPNQRSVRAAALGCYWRLCNYVPGCLSVRWALDDTDELIEVNEWVDQDSPAYAPIRRFYASILGLFTVPAEFSKVASWMETRWEIRNAFAASDWGKARDLFDYAERRHLLPSPDIAGLRLQFESLRLIGPHLDALLGAKGGSLHDHPDSSLRAEYRLRGHRFSLEHLYIDPVLYAWTGDESGPHHFLVVLPVLDQPLPIVTTSDCSDLTLVFDKIETLFEELPDRGLVQRSIGAYMLEAMDERGRAAKQYRILADFYKDLLPVSLNQFYILKAAEAYQAAGDNEGALEVVRSLLHVTTHELKVPPIRLATAAFNLGLVERCRYWLHKLSSEEKTQVRGYLKAVMNSTNSEFFANLDEVQMKVTKRLFEWPYFSRLSSAAKTQWRSASLYPYSIENVGQIKNSSAAWAVVDFASGVEIELRRIFIAFRKTARTNIQSLPEAFDILVTGTLTLVAMIGALDAAMNTQFRSDRQKALLDYLGKRNPAVMRPETLKLLREMVPPGNDATPEGATKMSPHRAEELAIRIVEAIHRYS